MLSIRLTRMGKRNRPFYRVVVADSRKPRDGACVEVLGHYDPIRKPAVIKIDTEKIEEWIQKGAQPSDTVRSLLKQAKRQEAGAGTDSDVEDQEVSDEGSG